MSEGTGTMSGPPPGWYSDPGGTQALRWWDGSRWTSHSQPLVTTPRQVQDENAGLTQVPHPGPWAWTVAASPALSLAVAAAIATIGGSPGGGDAGAVIIGWLAGCVLACIAAYMDTRQAIKQGAGGGRPTAFICLLLSGWAYLLARAIQRRTGAWWGVFSAGMAAVLVAIGIIGPVASAAQAGNLSFNQAKAQSDLKAWIRSKTGETDTVSCPPDPAMTVGSTFTCVATGANGSTLTIEVMVTDNSGDVEWRLESS